MATRISSIVPFLVITLCCLVLVEGGYLALEYLVLQPQMRPPTVQRNEVVQTPVEKMEGGRQKDYHVILSRNLFGASPGNDIAGPTVQVEDVDGLEASGLGLVLMGTIADSENGNRAIILDKKSFEQKIYRQGQDVQGAKIKEVLRGKVVLSRNGRNEILDMGEAAKLRPVAKTEEDNQVKQYQPERISESMQKSGSEEPAAEEQSSPAEGQSSAEQVKGRKKLVLPLILRASRPVENN